jgi:bacterioferritin-associated ferredoxin
MFVCLCTGVTSHAVSEAVSNGASTSKEVAAVCGAGSDCGRCKRTVRSIIEAYFAKNGTPSAARR